MRVDRRWLRAGLVALGLGIGTHCGGGGSSSGGAPNPFPPAVAQLLPAIDASIRSGTGDLDPALTCGGAPVSNPLDVESDNQVVIIAGSGRANAGSVAQARYIQTETRNTTTGAATIDIIVRDEADSSRVFLDVDVTSAAPSIQFLPPPQGTTEFLAPDGTGQAFALLRIQQTITATRVFINDPAPLGNGDLVDFTGVPVQPDGTMSGSIVIEDTYLIEFDVTAGPPTNSACIVDIHFVGDRFVINRTGAASVAGFLAHAFGASVDTGTGPFAAPASVNGVVFPVGTDGISTNPVADGDAFHLTGGVISGGITGYNPLMNGSRVEDRDTAVIITDDGQGNPTDGRFDGVSTFSIDGRFNIAGGPGGVGNGNVDVSVLALKTDQIANINLLALDHPIEDPPVSTDLVLLLYLPVVSTAETGIVIYR